MTDASDGVGGIAERVKLALATSFYLGLAPVVPGTFGTLGGVAAAALLIPTRSAFLPALALLAALLYLVGRPLGNWAEQRAAGKDPGFFVLDEVIGYLIAVAWVAPPSRLTLVVGFVLFRFFDVVKPPPARRLERMGGGDGILLDDVVAGLYALAVMACLRLFVFEPAAWVSD